MTAPVLADALGPRARRRVLVVSVIAGALVLGLLYLAVKRFADNGQLDAEKWKLFTQWGVIKFFLGGLGNTLRVALVAMVLAVLLGFALALGRLALNPPVRWVSGIYIQIFRGLPVLLFILFAYNGLPKLGIDLSKAQYLILALVAYNSAVLGEIFRAGILSLDRGQTEAAYAVGLSYWSAMRLVVLPQALRRMVPAIVSQLVTLLKDTALGFIIGYEELLRRGQLSGFFSGNLLPSLIVASLIYIAVNIVLGRMARYLEVRQRRRLGAGPMDVHGVEELTIVAGHARSSNLGH
ncbi:MAG: glutamate transport system permease protein [Actinomycetota bacterium]|jgi:glutamate transport system permease protein|nr:glutamate transport system permease protein [Actinomycetota bacterium]